MRVKTAWKKAGLRLALALLLAGLLAGPAYANSSFSGYYLTVKMQPCPAEPYYIALLQEGDAPPNEEQRHTAPSPESLGPELWQALTRQLPEGWYMIALDDSAMQHQDGPGTEMRHRLAVYARTFRILVLTRSGEGWVSQPVTRTVAETYAAVDWAAKTVYTPPAWIAYCLNILSTMLPTLLIEGLVLVAFRYRLKQNWKPFLAVNCCTQGLLWVFFGLSAANAGVYSTLFLFLGLTVLTEPLIMGIEASQFAFRLKGGTRRRGILYAITANLLSFFLGLRVVPLLWYWVSETFYSLPLVIS